MYTQWDQENPSIAILWHPDALSKGEKHSAKSVQFLWAYPSQPDYIMPKLAWHMLGLHKIHVVCRLLHEPMRLWNTVVHNYRSYVHAMLQSWSSCTRQIKHGDILSRMAVCTIMVSTTWTREHRTVSLWQVSTLFWHFVQKYQHFWIFQTATCGTFQWMV